MPPSPFRTPLIAAVAFLVASVAHAQPLDSAFNPSPNGEVQAAIAQPDGKLIVGGSFTTIAGASRSRFAQLNIDGSADSSFALGFNGTVTALARQPDGRILVGGLFSAVGASLRSRLARLNSDGTLDAAFNPAPDNTVNAIVVQPDGKILVAGTFANIAGAPRTGLARLNSDGTIDASFDVAISGALLVSTFMIQGLALQTDGRVLFCGNFSLVAGQPRTGVARLLPSGVLDLSFVPPVFNSNTRGLTLLPNGKIFLVGNFSRFAAPILNYITLLNPDGSFDSTSVPPTLNGSAISAALQADGRILVGGIFTVVGGVTRGSLIRLNSNGTFDPAFAPEVAGTISGPTGSPYVYTIVVPPGLPNIVIGGAFATASSQPRPAMARFGTPLPGITLQPASLLAAEGATLALTVAATGDALRYQWKRNGVDLPGATLAVHAVDSLSAANSGIYTVAITNTWGTVTSAPASLSVGAAQAPRYTFSTLAGRAGDSGATDGIGDAARFINPNRLALDPTGVLYVSDSNGLRRIAPNASVTTLSRTAGQVAGFDTAGNIYTHASGQIRKFAANGNLAVVAGSLVSGYRDGPGASAQFSTDLRGTAMDRDGRLFIVDAGNLAIRRIDPAGNVSTVARFADTGPFLSPQGLTIDATGEVFFTDYFTGGIGQVTAAGQPAFFVGNLRSALEDRPVPQVPERLTSIAADAAGNFIVTDALNHVIRQVSAHGAISTIGGSHGISGASDGTGTTALFSSPFAIIVDAAGTLYLADAGNHTIRKGVRESVSLSIAAHPQTAHTAAATSTSLAVVAHGNDLRYQWKKDGEPVAGATDAILRFAAATAADMGYYTVAVTSAGTTLDSLPALLTVTNPANPGRLINVATRGLVPAGGALTTGFVLRGAPGGKNLIVRGIGPALLSFGVGGVLADPRLELIPLGTTVPTFSNDDWSTGLHPADAVLAADSARVGAFPLAVGAKDAALGAPIAIATNNAYTVRITGPDAAGTGLALAEVYDADALSSPVQLANVSTRGFVGPGASALIPGFVIGGGGPLQLLIRAVGPGLAPFGVTGLLVDPQISVVPIGRETPLATNDNWGGTATLSAAFAAAGAFALPAESKDAAVFVRLPPGAYTVVVSGVGNTTGMALVEVYDVSR